VTQGAAADCVRCLGRSLHSQPLCLLCCLCLTPAARMQAVWAASTTSAQGVKAKTGVMRASAMLAAALVALCCSTLLGHAEASWSGEHPFPPESTKWSPLPGMPGEPTGLCRQRAVQPCAKATNLTRELPGSSQCSAACRPSSPMQCNVLLWSRAVPAPMRGLCGPCQSLRILQEFC